MIKYLIVIMLHVTLCSGATPISSLEKAQINNPNDPVINYNLGVEYYKKDLFTNAFYNFQRAAGASEKNNRLAMQSTFNSGNASYKEALKKLPSTWQKFDTKIETDILDYALEWAKKSRDAYGAVLEKNSTHIQATSNKKIVEKLIQDLEQKKLTTPPQQNNNDKQDDKQDKQNNDNTKNDSDNQNKNSQNQDKKNESENKQDGSADNNKEDQANQDSKGKDQKQEEKNKNPEHEVDSKSQETPKEGKEPRDQGAQDKQEDQQRGDGQSNNMQHKQSPDKKDSSDNQPADYDGKKEATKTQEAAAAEEGKPQDTLQQKRIRALLESLEQDEASSQKRLLKKQMKSQQPLNPGEKPW